MNSAYRPAADGEFKFTEADFKQLAELATRRTAIMLPPEKRDMVYGRLARRLRALGLPSFRDYIEYLEGPNGDSELGEFVNAITTNLTSFFREPHHFTHLVKEALPAVMQAAQRRGSKRLRIWSAGCSSGMEPYSIAMAVLGHGPSLAGWDIKILATDIDTQVLSRARAGVYTADDAKSIPADLLDKFVEFDGQQALMKDKLKSLITFNQLNLIEEWPMKGQFDIIFCRNVIIYFDMTTKKRLFERMAALMPQQGWLYLGHSENIQHISSKFTLVGKTIYQRQGL